MGMSYVAPKTFLEAKLRFRNILERGYCNCTLLLVIDGLDCISVSKDTEFPSFALFLISHLAFQHKVYLTF